MTGLQQRARRYAFDVLVVVGAAVGAVVGAVSDGDVAPDQPRWAVVAAALAVPAPLLLRRRRPFGAPAALWIVAAGLALVDAGLVTDLPTSYVAGMAAAFLLGSLRDPARARLGLAVVVGGAVVIATQVPDHAAGDVVAIPAIFAVTWLAGTAQRQRVAQAEAAEERADRAEREREAAARLAVAEERVRIARELHDIVAHAVSVMVLQTGAVRHRLPPDGEDAQALRRVEATGRTAMAEMRRLLGALRRPDEDAELAPQPGLGRLDELVDEVRRAGLDVDLRVDGAAFPLPEALDVSAYRIVQEGLTNTLKHAHASHADVRVRYDEHEVRIDLRDDGEGDRGGAGHGLAGMRERVAVYGGDLRAGSAEGGGFALTARLPVNGART